MIKKTTIKKPLQPRQESTAANANKRAQEQALIADALEIMATGETSWEVIGSRLHPPLSGEKTKRMVKAHLKETDDEMRDIQRERLWNEYMQLRKAWWPKAVGYTDEETGEWKEPNFQAANLILKQMERIAGLFGLNAPTEVRHTHIANELLSVVKEIVPYDLYVKILSKVAELGSDEDPGGTSFGSSSPTSGGAPN